MKASRHALRIAHAGADILGESPLWHPQQQRLYWVDAFAPAIRRLDPTTGQVESFVLPFDIGSIVLHEDGGLVAGTRQGFQRIELAAGTARCAPLVDPLHRDRRLMLNDGKCDRRGRYWCATVHSDFIGRQAELYRLQRHSDGSHAARRMDGGFIIGNGIAFSPDDQRMYLADSRDEVVWVYDLDLERGEIGGRRPFFSTRDIEGRVDGATCDRDGNYWCALVHGGAVACIAPDGRLARRIEGVLTKQQILELYLNEIPLGRQSFGVEAAAQAYFGKSVGELTLAENAFLAALPRGPEIYGRDKYAARAIERRNWVIDQMVRNGAVSQAAGAQAKSQPLGVIPRRSTTYDPSTGYFVEEVRRILIDKYGENAEAGPNSVYDGGLWVRTSLDPEVQKATQDALRAGLLRYSGGRAFSKPIEHVKVDPDKWQSQLIALGKSLNYQDWRLALVIERRLHGHHGQFDEVSCRPLHRGIDGLALGRAAPRPIAAPDVGQHDASTKQGLHKALLRRSGFGVLHVLPHPRKSRKVAVDIVARSLLIDTQCLRQAVSAHAVDQPEVDRLGISPLLAAHVSHRDTKDLCGGRPMDILALNKGTGHAFVGAHVGHDAQLNLRVVTAHDATPWRCNEGLPHPTPLRGSDGNVLKIGIVAGQPTGHCHRLRVVGVHPARLWVNHEGQLIGVGGL